MARGAHARAMFERARRALSRLCAPMRAARVATRWVARVQLAGQRMLAVYNKAAHHEGGFEKAPFDEIAAQVGYSNPPCKPWIKELTDYVKAGPRNGELVHDLRMAAKAFATTTANSELNMIGQEFMAAINEVSNRLPKGEKYPYVMNAIIVANMTGGKVVDGIYKTFSKQHVLQLGGKKEREQVKKADEFMAHVRVVLKNMKMDEVEAFRLTVKNDLRAAYVLTKKHNAQDENFKTLDDVIKDGMVKCMRRRRRSSASFAAQPKGALSASFGCAEGVLGTHRCRPECQLDGPRGSERQPAGGRLEVHCRGARACACNSRDRQQRRDVAACRERLGHEEQIVPHGGGWVHGRRVLQEAKWWAWRWEWNRFSALRDRRGHGGGHGDQQVGRWRPRDRVRVGRCTGCVVEVGCCERGSGAREGHRADAADEQDGGGGEQGRRHAGDAE